MTNVHINNLIVIDFHICFVSVLLKEVEYVLETLFLYCLYYIDTNTSSKNTCHCHKKEYTQCLSWLDWNGIFYWISFLCISRAPVTSRKTEHGVLSGSDCIYAFRRLALIMNPYDLWVQEVTLLEVPSHLDILLYPYPHPHQERPWGHFLIEDGMAEREAHNSVSTVSFACMYLM